MAGENQRVKDARAAACGINKWRAKSRAIRRLEDTSYYDEDKDMRSKKWAKWKEEHAQLRGTALEDKMTFAEWDKVERNHEAGQAKTEAAENSETTYEKKIEVKNTDTKDIKTNHPETKDAANESKGTNKIETTDEELTEATDKKLENTVPHHENAHQKVTFDTLKIIPKADRYNLTKKRNLRAENRDHNTRVSMRIEIPATHSPFALRRSAWDVGTQDSDRDFDAINVQRRHALGEDMKAKEKTHEDYGFPVKYTFLERDGDGQTIAEENEKILYGPSSFLTTPPAQSFSAEDLSLPAVDHARAASSSKLRYDAPSWPFTPPSPCPTPIPAPPPSPFESSSHDGPGGHANAGFGVDTEDYTKTARGGDADAGYHADVEEYNDSPRVAKGGGGGGGGGGYAPNLSKHGHSLQRQLLLHRQFLQAQKRHKPPPSPSSSSSCRSKRNSVSSVGSWSGDEEFICGFK